MPNETVVTFPARLPKPLHSKLKKRAERNVRSLNSELIVAVRHYLTGELPEQPEAAQPVETIQPTEA